MNNNERQSWSLVRYNYDGDHKVYETLCEGTERECSDYAFNNFYDWELGRVCLLDPQGREWDL